MVTLPKPKQTHYEPISRKQRDTDDSGIDLGYLDFHSKRKYQEEMFAQSCQTKPQVSIKRMLENPTHTLGSSTASKEHLPIIQSHSKKRLNINSDTITNMNMTVGTIGDQSAYPPTLTDHHNTTGFGGDISTFYNVKQTEKEKAMNTSIKVTYKMSHPSASYNPYL